MSSTCVLKLGRPRQTMTTPRRRELKVVRAKIIVPHIMHSQDLFGRAGVKLKEEEEDGKNENEKMHWVRAWFGRHAQRHRKASSQGPCRNAMIF